MDHKQGEWAEDARWREPRYNAHALNDLRYTEEPRYIDFKSFD
jgi:hypothetical protein